MNKKNKLLYLVHLPFLIVTVSFSPMLFALSNSNNSNPEVVNSIVDKVDMKFVKQKLIDLSQCIGSVDLGLPIDGNSTTDRKVCSNGVTSVRGWRLGGTPEENQVADYVANAFTSILGTSAVTKEAVPTDMWRFLGASLTVKYGSQTLTIPAASIGGSSIIATGAKLPKGCITGSNGILCNYNLTNLNLVWVNKGLKNDYNNLVDPVTGKLPPNTAVLYSWDDTIDWASAQCYEAQTRGAAAVIQTTLPELGSFYYYQADKGGGTFDMVGDGSACPPMITIAPKHARQILNVLSPSVLNAKNTSAPTPMTAQVKLNLEIKESTVKKPNYGYNVIAKIVGTDYPNELIIFSGHHDAYFQGATDDEAAIALMLGMAKAIVDSGYKPKRTFVFVSVTAEEYGVFDSVYDWLAGSLHLTKQHPEWGNAFNGGEFAVAELNVGDVVPAAFGGKIQYSATNDLLDVANNWFSSYAKDIDPQLFKFVATYVDQYTYYHFGGIPNIGFDQYLLPYYHNNYHTDSDTIDLIDFNLMKQVAKINFIAAIALDNASTLPYDYGDAISRLKNSLNLTNVHNLVSIGSGEGVADCSNSGIDNELNVALSNAGNANAQLQNTKSPVDKPAITLVNKYIREASRVYSTLSTSDGAITPQSTFLHVPAEREALNMNAAIEALQSNKPADALNSLLKVTPYINIFVTNFSEATFNQRLSDYGRVAGVNYPAVTGVVGPNGTKSLAWGEGTTPPYGFYQEYQSISKKIASGNKNFEAELNSIKSKRNEALGYYCRALNKTLQVVTDLTTAINNAKNAAQP